MRTPDCINCNEPMRLASKPSVIKGRQYKARRYICDICDYEETIYGGGARDIDDNPLQFDQKAISEPYADPFEGNYDPGDSFDSRGQR